MIASQIMLDHVMKMVIVVMLQVELNAPISFVDPQKKQKEKMIASQIMLDLVMKMVIVAMWQVELNVPISFVDPQKK